MKNIQACTSVDLAAIETLVLAGGGNRCWWQAGALSHWLEKGWRLPAQMIGTSAGAAVAAACLTRGQAAALDACVRLYSANARIFDWSGVKRGKLEFAHQHIYPAWIDSFVNAATFATLRATSTQLRVAITRPAQLLGLRGSVLAGTLAYLVDKYFARCIHPRLPGWFGLRQDFVTLNGCASVEEAQNLLVACASAPPIMSARLVGAQKAMDGGYFDNAPLIAQDDAGKARSLVLLTRHYPCLPRLFRWGGRHYWQPSAPVPVSTWECLPRTPVREAFAFGVREANACWRSGQLRFG